MTYEDAKASGIWLDYGFDANNYLLKELDNEVKLKLENIKKNMSD